LVFAIFDGTGQVDRVAVEEELLGQRRLTRVRVGDDGEGAAAGDFCGRRHGKSGQRTEGDRLHDQNLRRKRLLVRRSLLRRREPEYGSRLKVRPARADEVIAPSDLGYDP
jgi:hypothetical protein